MLEPYQPAEEAQAVAVVAEVPRWGAFSRMWTGRPSLPDYFRDMLAHDPCTHPELLARII